MKAAHLEFLVEELSMEAFLTVLLPKLLPPDVSYKIHVHQGKPDLLNKLESRLRAYSKWLPADARVVAIVDRDDSNCEELKAFMETCAAKASMPTPSTRGTGDWRVVNRIAIEELEAWYFGEWAAVRAAFPRVSARIPHQAGYRDPDGIGGGTWEAFERVLKRAGYFPDGLRKVEAAQQIAQAFDPEMCSSQSFDVWRQAILEAVA